MTSPLTPCTFTARSGEGTFDSLPITSIAFALPAPGRAFWKSSIHLRVVGILTTELIRGLFEGERGGDGEAFVSFDEDDFACWLT